MGTLIHRIESRLKPETIYSHLIDMSNYEREMTVLENIIGQKLSREQVYLERDLNKKLVFVQQGLTHKYVLEPFNNGSVVTYEVQWSGVFRNIIMGLSGTLRKMMIKLQFVTAIMEFEEGYLFARKSELNENNNTI